MIFNFQQNTNDWSNLEGSLAQLYLSREVELVNRLLPEKYYALALQLGQPCGFRFLDQVNSNIKVYLDQPPISDDFNMLGNTHSSHDYRLLSTMHQLPFGRHSADLIMLPHTLDLSSQPVLLLREISQVLEDDGVLVLTGFNPASLLGLSKYFSRSVLRRKSMSRSYSVRHVKDWLQLIGFEVFASCYHDYLPPVSHLGMRRSLSFLEKAGDRWWPVLAGIYIILASKKDWQPAKISMLDHLKKRLNGKLPQPTASHRG